MILWGISCYSLCNGSVEIEAEYCRPVKIDSDQYTISASNNINAGVGKATLTVTAAETGNYSGSVIQTASCFKKLSCLCAAGHRQDVV